jgi:hypothetical protein
MAATNALLTNLAITNEALMVLRNQFVLVPRCARTIDDMFGKVGHKNGDTVSIRIPVRYKSAQQTAINLNNTTETNTSLQVLQRNIGVDFSTEDLKLKIDLFSDRILKPQMAQLASDIDQDGFKMALQGGGLTTPGAYTAGVPAAFTGADVSTLRPFLDAGARLDEAGAPRDHQRYVALTPSSSAAVVDGLKGLFQSATQIAEQYKTGLMGLAAGFEWVMTQNLPPFTTGTRIPAAGMTVNGGGNPVTGASIVMADAAITTTVTAGDQFVIAGVYSINPLTRSATSKLQVFTVLTAGAFVAGAVTLSVYPSINVTSPNETVSAAAADGAIVTFLGAASTTTDVNLVWHRDAFMVAFCDLPTELPGGEAYIARDPVSGISIRFAKQWDPQLDVVYHRADVLYGFKLVRPQLAQRVQG